MITEINNDYLKKVIIRFDNFTIKTNHCWGWKGALTGSGYGNIWVNNKNQPASRISWIIYNGKIPKGLYVLHKCDNRICSNPRHLFLGTMKDNSQDMLKKNRCKQIGENCHFSKITNKQREEIIKRCFIKKEKQKIVALDYKITPQAVRFIVKRAEIKYGKINGTDKKTTRNDRLKIKALHESGLSLDQIAKQFNLTKSTVHYIVREGK